MLDLFKNFQKKFFVLFIVLLIYFIVNPFLTEGDFKKYFFYASSILILLSFTQILISLIDLILKARFFEQFDHTEKKKGIKTIGFLIRLVIWLIVIFMSLSILGIKIGSLLTGLGISGVIIALATQSIFTDLFSYFTILADKPFEVGDFVSYDNLSGTVEYIGIKSTRIRLLDGELLIVPNTILTGSKLRNFKNLEKRRVFLQLKLPINTTIKKIEDIQSSIKDILQNFKETELERCYITTISDLSIQFDVYYYITTQDFNEFLKIKHLINIEILKLIQKMKIKLVSNIQSINLLNTKEDETKKL